MHPTPNSSRVSYRTERPRVSIESCLLEAFQAGVHVQLRHKGARHQARAKKPKDMRSPWVEATGGY